MVTRGLWRRKAVFITVALGTFATPMLPADDHVTPGSSSQIVDSDPDAVIVPAKAPTDEIAQLRHQLAIQQEQIAAQQKQIDCLVVTLEAQQKAPGRTPSSSTDDKQAVVLPAFEKLGEVASTTPLVPVDARLASAQNARPAPSNLPRRAGPAILQNRRDLHHANWLPRCNLRWTQH